MVLYCYTAYIRVYSCVCVHSASIFQDQPLFINNCVCLSAFFSRSFCDFDSRYMATWLINHCISHCIQSTIIVSLEREISQPLRCFLFGDKNCLRTSWFQGKMHKILPSGNKKRNTLNFDFSHEIYPHDDRMNKGNIWVTRFLAFEL